MHIGARLLGKQKTAARHAMPQRNGGHRKRPVFINQGGFFRLERVEEDFIGHLMIEECKHRRKKFFQTFGRMDMQVGRTPQEIKRGYQSQQPETVVAVQVGDEDTVQTREFEA